MAKRVAVITGAGSGLGRELAIGLATQDYKVFGTAFSKMEIEEAESSLSELDVTLTVCDITKRTDIDAWLSIIAGATDVQGIDLLINNAGVLTPGPMELIKLDAIRHEFEVNVFGSLSVINACLPHLRTTKGRIVQISSGSGFFALPFSGPSSASKAAMESFADVFRTELRVFGIVFIVVEPGNMATGGPAKTAAMLKGIAESMTEEQRTLYGNQFAKFSDSMNAMQSTGMSATEAAYRIISIAGQTPAPARARVGEDAENLYQLARSSSDEKLDTIRRQMFSLGD